MCNILFLRMQINKCKFNWNGFVLEGLIIESLATNKDIELTIIIPIKASKYSPLSGSFANEWTLSIIPDLTINAPKRLKENTDIDNNNMITRTFFHTKYYPCSVR